MMNNEQNRHDPEVIRRAEEVLTKLFQTAIKEMPDRNPGELLHGILTWVSKK